MTIYDSIIEAAKIRLKINPDEVFRSGELRVLCGAPQGSFSPIFKGMRTDPGTAPLVHERAQGLFIQVERGWYQLSEKGKATISGSSAIPFTSPLEFKASKSLEVNGYWSAIEESDDRQRTLVEVVQRKGQPLFRQCLLYAYQFRCAISNCDAVPALEAAHISPYRGAQSNVTRNGLLLRADFHTLFDLNLIAIEPMALIVRLSKDLLATSYAQYHMKSIALPVAQKDIPDREALELRYSEFICSEGEN